MTFDNVRFETIKGRGLMAVVERLAEWQRGIDLPVVGSDIRLNGLAYTILGIECGTGMGGCLVGPVAFQVQRSGVDDSDLNVLLADARKRAEPVTQAAIDVEIAQCRSHMTELDLRIVRLQHRRKQLAGAEVLRLNLLSKVSWTLDEAPGLVLSPWVDEWEEQDVVGQMRDALRDVGCAELAPGVTLSLDGHEVQLAVHTWTHLQMFQTEHNLTLVPVERARKEIAESQAHIKRWSMFLGDTP